MNKQVIFGPPGSGKTTFIMNLLEKELKRTPAERIALVSFTRQGTYEAVARAIEKFSLNKEQTRHFKTIHSLCFSNLGVNRSMMISKNHYRLLSDSTGIAFTGYYTEDMSSQNDALLHCLSMKKHNPSFGTSLEKDLNAKTLAYVSFQYNAMKKQLGILDFDDLLLNYFEYGEPLDIDVAFIDEAQDLTPLQWNVIKKLFSNAGTIYVAGDDDQAVYEWSGANVNEFMGFSNNHTVLNHSYRMPSNILKVVKNITKDISHRKEKEFTAKEETGIYKSVGSINNVEFNGGELVLARTNWILRGMASDFSIQGIPYLLKGKPSIDKLTLKAIKAHLCYEAGQIEAGDMKKYKDYFRIIRDENWQKAINLDEQEILHYYKFLENCKYWYSDNVKKFADKPPVKFETYHSCKGSENDHVVLAPDLSQRVYKNMFSNYDSELRCLYVGMTRTKKDLTVIMPNGKHFYPSKYFRE